MKQIPEPPPLYNRPALLSPAVVFEALAADLAAAGIVAAPAALLRHLHRKTLVSRPLPPSSAVERGHGAI